MQRPKQQALAFLLGALLVGAVVGFSADRVLSKQESTLASRRKALYDDLDLAPAQRVALDSVFDASNCQMEAALKPIQPALDSIRQFRKAAMDGVLTPEQRSRLEDRRKADSGRRDSDRSQIKSACPK